MRIEASAIAHAPPDDVWAWWTDYGPQGTETRIGHGWGSSRRRVVERDGNRIVLVEEMPLPMRRSPPLLRHEVTLHPNERRIHETGREPMTFESDWYFEPTADGQATRIRRVLAVRSRALDTLSTMTAPLARRMAERDLKHHVREFEDEAPRPHPTR